MRYEIKDKEVGFVKKKGRFERIVLAGSYYFPKCMGYEVEIEEMEGRMQFQEIPYQILQKDAVFAESVVHVEIPDDCVGFIYRNGKLWAFAAEQEYTFWNVYEKYEVRLVSMKQELEKQIDRHMLSVLPRKYYTEITVKDGEVGLLYFDNVFQKELPQGVYDFWNYEHAVSVRLVNKKQQELEIAGQEILTKDKIGIRMNISCLYRIEDALEYINRTADGNRQLYSALQLVVRKIVGRYKLDEILEDKENISEEIYKSCKELQEMFCVQFLTVGIKDIILPGEIREIMNSVLVAEKQAQASVITRREEVASTRSLLNTAKLMDENRTLYKLKELEYLERICQQVGMISVNGNAGIIEQLGKMWGMDTGNAHV